MKTYKIRNKANGGVIEVPEHRLAEFGLEIPKAAKGGMIKRADGSYSRRGLWDNIRANKGSGKKPTKEMLKQERKIRAAEKAYGGYMEMGGGPTDWMMGYGGMYDMGGYTPMDMMASGGCMECGGRMAEGGKLPEKIIRTRAEAHMGKNEANKYVKKYLDEYQRGGTKRFPKEVIMHASNPNLMSDAYLRGVFEQSINPKWDSATRAQASKDYDDMLKAREYVNYLDSLKKADRINQIENLKKSPSLLDNVWGYTKDFLNFEEGGYLDEAGDGKWIQKATASIKKRGTEGVCTGSKFGGPSCPPGSKRYNLAKTFRKMAKSRKEYGGYAENGDIIELAPNEYSQAVWNEQFYPSGKTVEKTATKINPSKTTSIVDYLSAVGMKSDKESRKKLAKELGIKDYDFSAAKNTELLNKLRNPKGTKNNPYELPEVTVTASRSTARPGSKANPYTLPEVTVVGRRDIERPLMNNFGPMFAPDNTMVQRQVYGPPAPSRAIVQSAGMRNIPYSPQPTTSIGQGYWKSPLFQNYETGGYVEGEEYEMSDAEIARLRARGYEITEI